MRELLALIVTVIVVMIVYAVFFADRPPKAPEGVPAPLVTTVLPVEPVLAVGDTGTVVLGNGIVRYGISVVTDSRCPSGAECADAGEGLVMAWVLPATGVRETVRLTTGMESPVAAGPLSMTLLELTPHPEAGHTVGRNEYRARVQVDRAP